MKSIILEAQSELSKKLGVATDHLLFVGMQSLSQTNSTYMPLFNIVDKKSEFYMTTRAAHVFLKRDSKTNAYTKLAVNDSHEAMKCCCDFFDHE